MKKTTLALALAMASGGVFANGLGEDRAWQFQSSAAKYVMLQQRMAEELLDAGGPGPGNTTITLGDGSTLVIGDAVAGDKAQTSTSNCINCSSISSTVTVGDNVTGNTTASVGDNLNQQSNDATQSNGTFVASNTGTVQSAIGHQTN